MTAALVLVAVLAATLPGPSMIVARGGSTSDARCEIYDPATHAFRLTASMSGPRYIPTATKLADGRVRRGRRR